MEATNKKSRVWERTTPFERSRESRRQETQYELVDGVVEMLPATSFRHQVLVQQLAQALDDTADDRSWIVGASVDVLLSEGEVRRPDIVAVRRQRLAIITQRGVEEPPDFVAEVLSAASIYRDRAEKVAAYARYGVPEFWIVDAANCAVEQYFLTSTVAEEPAYRLVEVYYGNDPVTSPYMKHVSFTMRSLLDKLTDVIDHEGGDPV